jgi:membrane-bound ClpP family serine protease
MFKNTLASALAFLLAALAAQADQVVLKNGKTLHGKVLDGDGGRVRVKVSETITMDLDPERVHRIIREEMRLPSRLTPSLEPGFGTRRPEADDQRQVVCFVPIEGSLDTVLLLDALQRAIKEALEEHEADAVVVELDTPGGRLDVTQEVMALVGQLPVRTVAYVRGGPQGGAFSAGAMIAVACREILMAPGTAIGAAAPLLVTKSGVSPVGEKAVSAITARVRSCAQKNGHPAGVAAAMVDADIELRSAQVEGRRTVLSIKEGMKPEAKPGVTLGEWVSKRGKLLTLTALEAREVGLAREIVSSRAELLAAIALPNADSITLPISRLVQEALARRERYLLELDAQIASYEAQAQAIDPAKFKYVRIQKNKGFDQKGDFLDEGQAWRARSDTCAQAANRCLKACRKKLMLARRYPELGIDVEPIRKKMTQMLVLRERVLADRGRRGSERSDPR